MAGATGEFWRWTEGAWVAPDKSWQAARVVTLGVDVGSVSSEAVVCLDGELYAYSTTRTGPNPAASAPAALQGVLDLTGLTPGHIHYTVGTGYGRVNIPFADRAITEIACHGRGMEVLADLLEVPIQELGPPSFDSDEEPPAVSDVCVVFAESEAVSRLREGWSKNKVIAAYCRAMAERVAALLERIGVEAEFFVTGGISKNSGVVRRIERSIGVEARQSSFDSQIAGAVGAALFGYTLYLQGQGGLGVSSPSATSPGPRFPPPGPGRESMIDPETPVAEGWTRRSAASEPRQSEVVAAYEAPGWEVLLVPAGAAVDGGAPCTACFGAPAAFDRDPVVYARPEPGAPPAVEELFQPQGPGEPPRRAWRRDPLQGAPTGCRGAGCRLDPCYYDGSRKFFVRPRGRPGEELGGACWGECRTGQDGVGVWWTRYPLREMVDRSPFKMNMGLAHLEVAKA